MILVERRELAYRSSVLQNVSVIKDTMVISVLMCAPLHLVAMVALAPEIPVIPGDFLAFVLIISLEGELLLSNS